MSFPQRWADDPCTKFPQLHLLKWAAMPQRRILKMAACKLSLVIAVACSDPSTRVVLDSRVGYEMKEGYPIIFEFGTEDVVKNWAKMILPKLSGLPQKVAEMESPKIGLNFEFEDLPQPQNT
jgi:hypothetical protein